MEIYTKLHHLIKPFSKVISVWDSSPQAILMNDLKSTLKEDIRYQSEKDKRTLIKKVLRRLAVLHSTSFSETAIDLPNYQITSQWHEWCSDQLIRLCSRNHWANSNWIKVIDYAYDQLDLTNYKQSSPQVLTHEDPHFENIFYRDEWVWFIDWEWAAIASPLRDITILCQDLYDIGLIQFVRESYQEILKNNKLHIPSVDYLRDFNYLYIHHTTMMLAWEIEKYFQGHTTEEQVQVMINFKIREIKRITNETLIFYH